VGVYAKYGATINSGKHRQVFRQREGRSLRAKISSSPQRARRTAKLTRDTWWPNIRSARLYNKI
jgi:hypothetical protein